MLRSIAILASLLLAISAEPTILQSPRVTNWGEWTGKRCPSGQFVRGLRVKYDNAQYFSDQTGINAIELVCHNRSDQVDTYLKSGEGPHGDWLELQYCPEGEYGVGFAIRSAGPLRGRFDDYGVVNFQLYCGQPNGKRNSWHRLTGVTFLNYQKGEWSSNQYCQSGKVVCGINTQIETDQGWFGDDTGLNNADLWCCDF